MPNIVLSCRLFQQSQDPLNGCYYTSSAKSRNKYKVLVTQTVSETMISYSSNPVFQSFTWDVNKIKTNELNLGDCCNCMKESLILGDAPTLQHLTNIKLRGNTEIKCISVPIKYYKRCRSGRNLYKDIACREMIKCSRLPSTLTQ